jgi:hypothetical protein
LAASAIDSEVPQSSIYNCFAKVLFKQFAICLILPAKVPENTGYYGINQLAEYLHANFDFSYVTLMNLVRARNFVSKFKLSIPHVANMALSQKQIKFYEKQYEQLQ